MSYCTQNNWDCETCALVNYGLDCHNNRVVPAGPCDNCGKPADGCHCGDYVDTSPLSESQKAKIAENYNPPSQTEIDDFFNN